MEDGINITREDVIFFMDMVGSTLSPNVVPKMYRPKPYFKILMKKGSDDYNRFIGIYKVMIHVLTEREQIILNEMYGVDKESAHLKTVAELLNLSPERVRQIRNQAEYKIIRRLLVQLKDELNPTT